MLDQAIREGCRLHAFRSGGGLRVVQLERNRKLLGYGEHPHVEVALQHADEDYAAGGRPYEKVYGGTEPHYRTGSSDPSSPLDAWVLKGRTFDAWATPEGIVVELVGSEDLAHPKEIIAHVLATGEAMEWADRGFRFCSSRTEDRLALPFAIHSRQPSSLNLLV